MPSSIHAVRDAPEKELLPQALYADNDAIYPPTSAIQKASQKEQNIENLAYRVFDGVTFNYHYCKLKNSTRQTLGEKHVWHKASDLPWFTSDYGVFAGRPQNKTVGWLERELARTGPEEYTFLAGTSFADITYHGSHIGFCYALNSKLKPLCICGGVGFPHDDFEWVDRPFSIANEEILFKGCEKLALRPESPEPPVELMLSGMATSALWIPPMSLWLRTEKEKCERHVCEPQWCETKVHMEDEMFNEQCKVHGLAYCAVMQYVQDNQETLGLTREEFNRVWYYLLWAADYDQSSSMGWFKASTMRHVKKFADLHKALRGISSYDRNPNSAFVLETGRSLCRCLQRSGMEQYAKTYMIYSRYMEKVSLRHAPPPSGQKPLFLIAAGPPTSGKSIKSMTELDYELICDMTMSGSDQYCPFKNRKYEHLQASIVELNVDRLLEASDLSIASKAYLKDREDWIEAVDHTPKRNAKESQNMKKMKQDIGQKDYWFLRKTAGIDDLSNAHIQLTLAMRQDAIYETLLGNAWVDWALAMELPKAKAAGYEIVLVNYVVPFDELVRRASEREERTGQESAPAAQIRGDVTAALINFMNPELLKMIDFGITMTHVNGMKTPPKYEQSLVSFINRNGHACFNYCAEVGAPNVPSASSIETVLERCNVAKCNDSFERSEAYIRLSAACGNPTHISEDLSLTVDACKEACNARTNCNGFDSNGTYCYLKGNCGGSPGASTGYRKSRQARTGYGKDQPASRYEKYDKNCYGGRGADSIEWADGSTNKAVETVLECQQMCDALPRCGGFVWGDNSCWPRAKIDIANCKKSMDFDTYVKA